MSECQDPHQTVVVFAYQEFRQVARQGGLHHGIRGELGLGGDAALQFVDDEGELKRHRILRPEAAVVVEDGDTFGQRHEVLAAGRGNSVN
ncbi:MAG: hypothetical protein ACREA0_04750, partial [bacterium]